MNWNDIWLNFQPWIPALTSTTFIGVVGSILGPYYRAKIEKNIQRKFDSEMEHLRSQLRQNEEIFKSGLRGAEDTVASLRNGALSGMFSRHAALDKRRLDAVERLWMNVVEMSPLKSFAISSAAIRMDNLIQASMGGGSEADKVKQFAEILWTTNNLDKVQNAKRPDSERPFLSPPVWAAYNVYMQVLHYPFLQLAIARAGMAGDFIKSPDDLLKLVKATLPHQREFIEKYGSSSLAYLVEDLEKKLLDEIHNSIYDDQLAQNSVDQASLIMEYINKKSLKENNLIDKNDIPPSLRNDIINGT